MKHYRLFFPLLLAILVLGVPAMVQAGCPGYNSTTDTDNASGCSRAMSFPTTGQIILFNGPVVTDGGVPTGFSSYWQAIVDDFNAHHDSAYSWSAASYSEASDLWGDFYFGPYVNYSAWDGRQYSGFAPYYTYATAKRVCQIIAFVKTGSTADVEPSWEEAYTDDTSNDKDNLIFDGSTWRHVWENDHYDFLNDAAWSSGAHKNAIHNINKLTCISTAKPSQSLSLDQSSIAAGGFTYLRFADNDYYSKAAQTCTLTSDQSSDPGNALVVLPPSAGVPSCGNGVLVNRTKSGDPKQTSPLMNVSRYDYACTSRDFLDDIDSGMLRGDTAPANCSYTGSVQRCVTDDGRIAAAAELAMSMYRCTNWITVENDYSCTVAAPSGAIKVSPSVTTTYTYSCTNINGTTDVKKTLTVGGCVAAGGDCSVPNTTCPSVVNTGKTACDADGKSVCMADGKAVVAPPDTSCPAPVATFSNNGPVSKNSSATLSWTCANSTRANIDHDLGDIWTGPYTDSINDTKTTASLTADTIYTLSCFGPGAPGKDTKETTVQISSPPCADGGCSSSVSCDSTFSDSNGNGVIDVGESVRFTASPGTLGGTAYTWNPSEADTNTITGSTFDHTYSAGGNYQMRVSASGRNSGTCNVTIGADCGASPSGTLTAAPARVKQGGTTTLSWSDVKGVHTSCSIIGAPACVVPTPNSSCDLSSVSNTCTSPAINTQTTFTLRCDGTDVDSAIVDVIPNIIED